MLKSAKTKIILLTALFLIAPFIVSAFSEGEVTKFYIDPSYDLHSRDEIDAYLLRATSYLYFYLDKSWWESRTQEEQNNIRIALFELGEEFKNKIYPILTSNFGQEWKPGIDKDERITVLFHPMKTNKAGYYRQNDEYFKLQAPSSNEREMVYLNSEFITSSLAKSFLAHEFVHLITFYQKEKIRSVVEETWLNEGRAEYAPTLLGYDNDYKGSNLGRRVKVFLENPNDSLTEWQGVSADYGILNVFIQYLADHYGVVILRDSLLSPKTGINSLNYALRKNGFSEDFSQIFTNWSIAVLVNDCSLAPLDSEHLTGWSSKYCYKNQNLRNIRIVPESNFIPMATEASMSVYIQIKNWSPRWQKLFGGKGGLTLKFIGKEGVNFKVPYVLCDYEQKCSIKFFNLDKEQKGEIIIPDFSSKYSSLTLIPSVQNKLSDFSDNELAYPFSWEVKTKEQSGDDPELIKKLLERIDFLKAEIARIQAKISTILSGGQSGSQHSCSAIVNNLYFGLKNNQEVSCLQEFLKNQGVAIYPEGLVTGNFLNLTKTAVIRFQEKYTSEILIPFSLEKGTGYVGLSTRTKINKMLGF